jgi:hypothetical protein
MHSTNTTAFESLLKSLYGPDVRSRTAALRIWASSFCDLEECANALAELLGDEKIRANAILAVS